MPISEDHRKLAQALIEGDQPEKALEVLAYGMIPIEDSSELKDLLLAKLLHMKRQKPYVRYGKPLLKALDDVAPFLAEAHKNVRKPVFTVTDREALIKALNKSPAWSRFDVKQAVAYVTKKEVKEGVVGRQDLVLAIVLARNPSKPYAKIFFGHLDALHDKVLTFGFNFFRELPEQNEQEGRVFSWKVTLEDTGTFYDAVYANFNCDIVADHATNDFKGTSDELAKELLKRVKAEGKRLFDEHADMFAKGKRNKDKAYQNYLADSYKSSVSFLSKDFDRMHARDKRVLEALGDDPTYDIEVQVL